MGEIYNFNREELIRTINQIVKQFFFTEYNARLAKFEDRLNDQQERVEVLEALVRKDVV